MGRRGQHSKRAREHKKQAEFAGLDRLFAHPSHISGIRRLERFIARKRANDIKNAKVT